MNQQGYLTCLRAPMNLLMKSDDLLMIRTKLLGRSLVNQDDQLIQFVVEFSVDLKEEKAKRERIGR